MCFMPFLMFLWCFPWLQHSCREAWRLISTLPLCLDSILKKYLPLCLVSVALAHSKVLQPAMQPDSQPGWRPRAQGCASWARNPKGSQIKPFWHQLGRHPTVLDIPGRKFCRISARISPDRSHPLNLNFSLTLFGTRNDDFWHFGMEKLCKKVEIEGGRPIWRDPRRNSASAGLSGLQNGWMATRLVTKRCDLGSLGVPGLASTPLGPHGPWAPLGRNGTLMVP